MSNMVMNDLNTNTADQECNTALATDPFTALKAHFGMLLGVADFQTIDAYHRGKQWLHSAWLHRQGVVWGFGVSIDTDSNEIRVAPGLAVDGLGRELSLQRTVCLNLPAWLEKHQEDQAVIDAIQTNGNQLTLNAHVVIQFKACLSRQVPALMEPCDGGGSASAYSRILETVEVKLVPGPAPLIGESGREKPYHRLRLLFNLTDPIEEDGSIIESDQDVLDRRANIVSLAAANQPKAYLQALREFAALETVDMDPVLAESGEAVSHFPATDPAWLVLADLNDLILEDNDLVSGDFDNRVRDSHIATSTIQELLCGPLFSVTAGAQGDEPGEPIDGSSLVEDDSLEEDSGGARIISDSLEINDATISVTHEGPRLLANSLEADQSILVSAYRTSSGWSEPAIESINYDSGTKTVNIILADESDADLLRVIFKGTGLTPVLDTNRIPLAGIVGGAIASGHDGHDFLHMIKLEG